MGHRRAVAHLFGVQAPYCRMEGRLRMSRNCLNGGVGEVKGSLYPKSRGQEGSELREPHKSLRHSGEKVQLRSGGRWGQRHSVGGSPKQFHTCESPHTVVTENKTSQVQVHMAFRPCHLRGPGRRIP